MKCPQCGNGGYEKLCTVCGGKAVDSHDLRQRARVLGTMASFSWASGNVTACEGYLLELLAWCAFSDKGVSL